MIRFLYLWLLALPAFSQTYYVSPSGSDTTGNGSIGNRFATPWFAAFTARSTGVKSIKLASGNYYNTLISLTNTSDSGLTIEAETGAIPILYGGQPVTGWVTNGTLQEATLPAFPSYTNNILELAYSGDIPSGVVYITNRVVTNWMIRDLTVDNFRVPQARLPDYGSWLYYIVPTNINYGIMKYAGTDVPSSTVISNAEFLFRWTWQANKMGATNIDTTAKTVMLSPLLGRHFGSQGFSNYALFNTAEGMTNGVWYHDRVNNKLIIRTNSLEGKTVIAPTRSSVIYLIGVSNVAIRGLTIRNTTHPYMVDTIGGRDFAGAIDGWDNYGTTIENCVIENVCASGVRLGIAGITSQLTQLQNCNISSNTLNNCGAAGLCFFSGTARNNSITNYGEILLAGAGIEQNGSYSYIASNTVNYGTWTGISSSLGYSNVITFNTIFNPFRELDDAAAIYTAQCSNVFIGFNKMYILSGRQEPGPTDGGMSFDGGANYGSMVSNLVVNFHYPITFNGTTGSFASNNICLTTGTITCAIAAGASGELATHNIFDSTGLYLIRDAGTNLYYNNYFYSPLGSSGVPSSGIFASSRMVDDQGRLVHASQIISPRIQPLVGLVPTVYSTVSTVRTGSISQP